PPPAGGIQSSRSGNGALVLTTSISWVSGPLFATTSRTSPAGRGVRETLIRKSFSVTCTTVPLGDVECDEQPVNAEAATAHAKKHGRTRAARRSNGVRRRTSCLFGQAGTRADARTGDLRSCATIPPA